MFVHLYWLYILNIFHRVYVFIVRGKGFERNDSSIIYLRTLLGKALFLNVPIKQLLPK